MGEMRGGEEAMAKSLLAKGVKKALISEPDELPCKSIQVVDTVGAGDAFCGSLASYLATNRVGLERACSMACGYASMSVRKRGAQESYARPHELPSCLNPFGSVPRAE